MAEKPCLPVTAAMAAGPPHLLRGNVQGAKSGVIRVATANVLTMAPQDGNKDRDAGLPESGKMLYAQQQLLQEDIMACGIQEARTKGPYTRSMKHYLAIAGGLRRPVLMAANSG